MTKIDEETIRYIVDSKEICRTPGGQEYRVIGMKRVNEIARQKGGTPKDIEVAALEQGIIPRHYLRNMGTIGREGQIRLLNSCVAVVGAGGLGSTAIELLARQGIGRIVIVDEDCFTEEDLNRQILSTSGNLGEYKAGVAAKRVTEINSAIAVSLFVQKITKENACELLKHVQVVVDGLDNISSRFFVQDACRTLGIPFVHAAIAGFAGHLMTIFPDDTGLTSVYGPPQDFPDRGVETEIGNGRPRGTFMQSVLRTNSHCGTKLAR